MDDLLLRELEAQEGEETVKVRLSALRKRQNELMERRNRVEAEIMSHRRELKRVQLMDRSRLRRNTILNNQYMLVQLLGKGGFSEVWKAFDLGPRLTYVAVKVHQLNDAWSDEKKNNYTKVR